MKKDSNQKNFRKKNQDKNESFEEKERKITKEFNEIISRLSLLF